MEYKCKVAVSDKKLYSKLQQYCVVPDSNKCAYKAFVKYTET